MKTLIERTFLIGSILVISLLLCTGNGLTQFTAGVNGIQGKETYRTAGAAMPDFSWYAAPPANNTPFGFPGVNMPVTLSGFAAPGIGMPFGTSASAFYSAATLPFSSPIIMPGGLISPGFAMPLAAQDTTAAADPTDMAATGLAATAGLVPLIAPGYTMAGGFISPGFGMPLPVPDATETSAGSTDADAANPDTVAAGPASLISPSLTMTDGFGTRGFAASPLLAPAVQRPNLNTKMFVAASIEGVNQTIYVLLSDEGKDLQDLSLEDILLKGIHCIKAKEALSNDVSINHGENNYILSLYLEVNTGNPIWAWNEKWW